jgi:hypothetical protein
LSTRLSTPLKREVRDEGRHVVVVGQHVPDDRHGRADGAIDIDEDFGPAFCTRTTMSGRGTRARRKARCGGSQRQGYGGDAERRDPCAVE